MTGWPCGRHVSHIHQSTIVEGYALAFALRFVASSRPMRPDPLDRRPEESVEAYIAFCTYGGMPRRSLARTARLLHKSQTLMERWSARHAWVERIDAIEREVFRAERVKRRDAARHVSSNQPINNVQAARV